MLFIGIDEAGYGPLLGPLVVAGTVFRTADVLEPEELGARVLAAARRAGVDVGDSKRLFGATRELAALETPVLAFLATVGADAAGLDDLLDAAGVAPSVRRASPWYADAPAAFPLRARREAVAAAAAALSGSGAFRLAPARAALLMPEPEPMRGPPTM